MVTHACKLNLPQAHPALVVSSLHFEPTSNSIALMCTDSSILLHHPITIPSSPSPLSSRPIVIPPPATSATFLRLHPSPDPAAARVIFLASGPHRSSVLLRAWILRRNEGFAPAQLNFKHRDGKSGPYGAVLDLSHGFAIKIVGSINVFVVHSASSKKIWVLSARLVDREDGQAGIDLMKCGVIECKVPICSVFVSAGFLILGEENGVRVFPLRPLVKGRVSQKDRAFVRRKVNVESNGNLLKNRVKFFRKNGLIETISGESVFHRKNASICCNGGLERASDVPSNGNEGKAEAARISAKCKTVKLRQDSGELGSSFVAFKVQDLESPKMSEVLASLKAVSIHALSPKRFLILDSVGDVHLLSLHNIVLGSEVAEHTTALSKDCHMKRLECTMKVQILAVLPNISTRAQTVWVSDGCHSVHVTSVADTDTANVGEDDKEENEEKWLQISDTEAIFTSEKIRAIIPHASNGILVLGQGSIFAYATA